MINPTGVNLGPNPQDPDSLLYQFIDTQPESPYPNNPDSSLSHFTVRQFTPTAISATQPVIVTKTAHGLLNGMSVRTSKFVTMPLANATGMVQLNNRQFYVQQVTANTFQLWDANGQPIDGRGYTAYVQGGQFTVNGPEILCVNPSHFPPPGIPIFPPV